MVSKGIKRRDLPSSSPFFHPFAVGLQQTATANDIRHADTRVVMVESCIFHVGLIMFSNSVLVLNSRNNAQISALMSAAFKLTLGRVNTSFLIPVRKALT